MIQLSREGNLPKPLLFKTEYLFSLDRFCTIQHSISITSSRAVEVVTFLLKFFGPFYNQS